MLAYINKSGSQIDCIKETDYDLSHFFWGNTFSSLYKRAFLIYRYLENNIEFLNNILRECCLNFSFQYFFNIHYK